MFISEQGLVSRRAVIERFHRDEEVLVRGVLRDLVESGLAFVSGTGDDAVFRPSTPDEVRDGRMRLGDGTDELLGAIVYREGPLARSALLARSGLPREEFDVCLERLAAAGRIRGDAADVFSASEFVVPLDGEAGWEAALFDHYHALVRTLCCRLSPDPRLGSLPPESVGGSTYTFDVWPGHPLYEDVLATLGRVRRVQSELRQRVEAHNALHGTPDSFVQVVSYIGQSVVRQGDADAELESEVAP